MLPANVGTRMVIWQGGIGVVDGADVDQEPDMIPLSGTVTFTPSITHVQNVNASPNPVTISLAPIVGVLDEEGYLCTPVSLTDRTPMYRGVRLIATDDPDLSVKNWHYTVAYRFGMVNSATPSIPAHALAVPLGAEGDLPIDLSKFAPVPSSPPIGTPQALALLAKAEEAATLSALNSAAALDVVARADAGEFIGEPGPAGLNGSNVLPDSEAVAQAVTLDGPAKAALTAAIGDSVEPGGTARATIDTAIDGKIVPEVALTLAGQTALGEAMPTRARGRERGDLTMDGRRKIVLLTGQADQTYIVVNCTQSADTTRFMAGTRSTRFEITAAGTAQTIMDPVYVSPALDPYPIAPPSLLKAWIWIDDPSKITSIAFEMYGKAPGQGGVWTRSTPKAKLTPGWNLIQHKIAAGVTTDLVSLHRVAVHYTATAATGVGMGELWLECPPKAQILFIEDRGYKTFVDHGLSDLRALGIPVTWALDPMLLSSNLGTVAEAITEAQVAQFYAEGDDMSIHSYAGEVTNTMTRDQIIKDTLKSHKWLQDRGYTRGRQWRAAWTQDVAQQHAAAQPYYAAYATYISDAGAETWPPVDRFNMARYAIQGRTAAQIDAQFTTLEKTHGLLLAYTHGVHDNGGNDITHAEWDYFISKVQAGVTAGWLEGVTFSKLLERSGGVIR